LRCFIVLACRAAICNGNGANEEDRKDAEFLRTASVNVWGRVGLNAEKSASFGESRLAVATGRRSFSNEKRAV
jgi:hypothetical protein